MIDQGLNDNRNSHYLPDDSMDDARSVLEGLNAGDRDARATTEEEDIIKQTRELLAQLRSEQDNIDEAAEEAKKSEVQK